MKVIAQHLRPEQLANADVMLFARVRVLGIGKDESYEEGTVVAIEPMFGPGGQGECLRVMVDKRVVRSREQVVSDRPVIVIDTAIPMDRLFITHRPKANIERNECAR